jgi:DNA modification methylase
MAKKNTNTGKKLFDSLDEVQAMPEGYYSGDQPNPTLRSFMETNGTPFEPETDSYQVSAFTKAIDTTKATSLFNLHSYFSKKPHDAIRQYIRHYTNAGDVVLDSFCGSGGAIVSALLEDRKAIAIDRSPAATFITKNYCTPFSSSAAQEALSALGRKVAKEIAWLYGTKCDGCGGDAHIAHTVYSQMFKCPRCLAKVALFDCVSVKRRTAADKETNANACPTCHAKGHVEIIRSQSEKFGYVPVQTTYVCESGCKPSRRERKHNDTNKAKRQYFEQHDVAKIAEIQAGSIPYWFPTGYDMTSFSRYQRDALYYYGVKEVSDLFTKRNLWALALILHHCTETLRFALSAIVLNASRMYRHRDGGGGGPKGTDFMIPQIGREMNVWSQFESKAEELVAFTPGIQETSVCISTQNAYNISQIPNNTVDYIFTDPPYGGTIQYGELGIVWEAWQGFDSHWRSDEITIADVRDKTELEWETLMRKAMAECYRVLKPGRWLSLCYHDTSEGTWQLVQDIMAEVGFVVDRTSAALFIDTGQKTYNQLTADKATKRDLVINFRKPRIGEWRVTQIFIPANVDVPTFNELGRQVVRDFLTTHPGATKDRVYDAVVSCMVRKGQMEAHDFDALLKSVAEEVQQPVKEDLFRNKEPDLWGSHVQSRWYLKETADHVDHAEQAKEDAAAKRLEKFIGDQLKKHPELEGVHYSDLFEQYLPIQDKPRRLMADWLPEYFIKIASGTWRLPDKEEGEQLAKLREAGTLRRIKRFANALIDGVPVRDKDRPGSDVDLLDWLRQCRRAGLYEQGKSIYEKGGLNSANLSDEQQIEAEDDYRICVRRGIKDEDKPKKNRRKNSNDDE